MLNTDSLHAMGLDGMALSGSQIAAFQKSGRTQAAEARGAGILCRCTRVSRKAVVQAVAAGAASFEQVQSATGCATVCGACRWRVNEVFAAVTGSAYPIAKPRARAVEPRVPVGREGAQLFREHLVAEPPPETIAPRLRRHVVVAQVSVRCSGFWPTLAAQGLRPQVSWPLREGHQTPETEQGGKR